jgi:transcriptional regulator with XRE-family HTH domain
VLVLAAVTFGERLYRLLIERGITQSTIAERLGDRAKKLSFVRQQINQRFPGKHRTVSALAQALGVSRDDLLRGVETEDQFLERFMHESDGL